MFPYDDANNQHFSSCNRIPPEISGEKHDTVIAALVIVSES